MKRVALHTIGCKLNFAETAEIGKRFIQDGYKIVDIDQSADVVIINSCSVTEQADRECKQIIRRALRNSPDAIIAVVGCFSQLKSTNISEIKGVDFIIGNNEKSTIFEIIKNHEKKTKPEIFVSTINGNCDFKIASSAGFEGRTRAFIKIQDGCDYQCAYCTVPLARGASKSAPISDVIKQINEAVSLGYKEVVLTGVNIGDYGKNIGYNLLSLLKEIVKVDGLDRIRISSIEPNLLDDALLDFWFSNEKLCNHWHIPLQSGSNEILESMKRQYRRELFEDKVNKIKLNVPEANIGTDIIVGFPGETDNLFDETKSFIDRLPLSYLHVFSYSDRSNTKASEYNPKVSHEVKKVRSRILRQIGANKKGKYYSQFVNKKVSVLFESIDSNGYISGLTQEYVRVDVKTKENLTNKIVNVYIEKSFNDRCIGVIEYEN